MKAKRMLPQIEDWGAVEQSGTDDHRMLEVHASPRMASES